MILESLIDFRKSQAKELFVICFGVTQMKDLVLMSVPEVPDGLLAR
jgi:hypothetical protein